MSLTECCQRRFSSLMSCRDVLQCTINKWKETWRNLRDGSQPPSQHAYKCSQSERLMRLIFSLATLLGRPGHTSDIFMFRDHHHHVTRPIFFSQIKVHFSTNNTFRIPLMLIARLYIGAESTSYYHDVIECHNVQF